MIKLPGRLYLTASTFYRLFSGLLVLLILARYLTAEALGVSALAIAAGAIVSTVQDWGQNNVILRDLGRNPDRAAAVTSRSAMLRIAITIPTLAIALLVVYLWGDAYWIPIFTIVLSGSFAGFAEIVLAPNRALGRYKTEFVAVFVSGFFYIAIIYIAASLSGDLVVVSLAILISRLLQVGISSFASKSFLDMRAMLAAVPFLRGDLSKNASLAVEGTLVVITNQLDTIVLANLLPLGGLGVYQAGARFSQSISPLASILSVSSIPKLAWAVSHGVHFPVLRRVFSEFAFAALVMVIGFVLAGPVISHYVYQGKYPELSYLWPAFGVYSMLRLAAAPTNVYFISAGLAKHAAWLRFIFAVALVGSLCALVPPFGIRAVGHALCVAAALHLCGASWLYAREVRQWIGPGLYLIAFLILSVLVLWRLG
jgi:O-antigen/teichoic acid export membrane protein